MTNNYDYNQKVSSFKCLTHTQFQDGKEEDPQTQEET